MKFQVGDIVRLREDKKIGAQFFQAGSLGAVAATLASMEACLVALGHETTTQLLPASVLDLVKKLPGSGTQASVALEAAMRYKKGDQVRLAADRDFGDLVLPKGAPGAVLEVLLSLGSYLIDFEADATDRVVPDGALE